MSSSSVSSSVPASTPARTGGRARGPVTTVAVVALLAGLAVARFLQAPAAAPQEGSAPAPRTVAAQVTELEARTDTRPDDPRAWQQLAGAYVSRAIETADPAYYDLSQRAVDRAARLAPDSPATLLADANLRLSRHDFDGAQRVAARAHRENAYSADILGVLVDARVELGQYERAASTLQQMLDRDPGLPALARTSYIRELHGDLPGAIAALQQAEVAGAATPLAAAEIATLLGDLHRRSGDLDAAAAAYGRALERRPELPGAVVGQARVRLGRGDVDGAIAQLSDLVERIPQPGALALLGDLQALDGRAAASRDTYALVDATTRLAGAAGQVTDLEAAVFAADHGRSGQALRLARRAYLARPNNVYAADALAWASLQAGEVDRAVRLSARAVRLDSVDEQIRHHAAAILDAAGRRADARVELRRALAGDPWFAPGQIADATALARRLDVPVPDAWRSR